MARAAVITLGIFIALILLMLANRLVPEVVQMILRLP
jgi:hypothetical protein